MEKGGFHAQRMASSYFFAAPALAYGLFTSRLPALKSQLQLADGQIGFILLMLGSSTLAGLMLCGFVLERVSVKWVLPVSVVGIMSGISATAFAGDIQFLAGACIWTGLWVGLCDVAMNAQGIMLERRYNLYCLSFLHGISSLGGVVGSLAGSYTASIALTPKLSFCSVLGIFLVGLPLACIYLATAETEQKRTNAVWRGIGAVVWVCGALSLVCHIAEGSAGEWGSLLLHDVKGASQQQAALVFAAFTGPMVISRFLADRVRVFSGDAILVFSGGCLGALGMSITLLSSSPAVCLAGYGLMGIGLGPIVPILFSRAGESALTTPAQASSVVSILSYAGLLLFPPLLGMLDKSWGLVNTLWLVAILCLITGAGIFLPVMRPNKAPR